MSLELKRLNDALTVLLHRVSYRDDANVASTPYGKPKDDEEYGSGLVTQLKFTLDGKQKVVRPDDQVKYQTIITAVKDIETSLLAIEHGVEKSDHLLRRGLPPEPVYLTNMVDAARALRESQVKLQKERGFVKRLNFSPAEQDVYDLFHDAATAAVAGIFSIDAPDTPRSTGIRQSKQHPGGRRK